jgi:hypothetical protein
VSTVELERAQRALRIVAVVRLTTFLPLLGIAVVLALNAPTSRVAPVVAIAAIASRIALTLVAGALTRRVAHRQYLATGASRWWYEPRSRTVHEGEHAPSALWHGPYATRDDAERAPEIARERSAAWAADDD